MSANVIILLIVLYIVVMTKEHILPTQGITLFLFAVTFRYIQFYHYGQNIQAIVTSIFHYVGMFVLGLISARRRGAHLHCIGVLHMIIIATVLFAVCSTIFTLINTPTFISPLYRMVVVPWQGVSLPATFIGAYLCIGISLFGMLLLDMPIRVKIFYFTCAAMSTVFTFALGNRAQLVFALGSLIAILLSDLLLHRISIKRKSIYITLTLIAMIIAGYINNFLGFRTLIDSSVLGRRINIFGISDDPRISRIVKYFLEMFTYPMGRIREEFAHNMWIDVAVDAGIIPFLLLLVFSVLTVLNHFKMLKICNNDQLKGLLTCFLVGLLMQCLIEPVLHGITIVFQLLCFQAGMTSALIRQNPINSVIMLTYPSG